MLFELLFPDNVMPPEPLMLALLLLKDPNRYKSPEPLILADRLSATTESYTEMFPEPLMLTPNTGTTNLPEVFIEPEPLRLMYVNEGSVMLIMTGV